jgi:ankyrin repeat protein
MHAVLVLMYSPLHSLIVRQDNNTALHIAADIGRVAIVQVLIDRGANINALGKVRTYLTHRTLLYHRYICPTPRYPDFRLSVGSGASICLDSFNLTYHAVYFSPHS